LIGPRKRRNQLLGDLLELGVTINPGFFGPAGLDLAAETPEEIALEVVAEIQRIGAVILAAGGSSRFGQPKQLIPFRGRSLVETRLEPDSQPAIVASHASRPSALVLAPSQS
jgi:hypothetical protein